MYPMCLDLVMGLPYPQRLTLVTLEVYYLEGHGVEMRVKEGMMEMVMVVWWEMEEVVEDE